MKTEAQKKAQRRHALYIMGKLIVLVRPLIPVMILAVLTGVAGFLCAIFIPILGGHAVLPVLHRAAAGGAGQPFAHLGLPFLGLTLRATAVLLAVLAVLRGVFHCIEQYCNHYIAFKLLAIIRHHVFAALRVLSPAKLEGKDKGNLISLITTDIELLEVFYAHTISPIIIGVLTSLCMLAFIGSYSLLAAGIAFAAYVTVGVVIPLNNGKKTAAEGMELRNRFGELSSFLLESLYGLDEIIQYGAGNRIQESLYRQAENLAAKGEYLSTRDAAQRVHTNTAVLLFSFAQLFFSIRLFQTGAVDFAGVLAITLGMMSSFGPVLALAQLSSTLHQTLASGERVLALLEEKPLVTDIPDDKRSRTFTGLSCKNIGFSYGNETIFDDYSLDIPEGSITGIHGASGSGKSTLLKLFMRFWDVQKGAVRISDETITDIPTNALRNMESFVTQDSHLFKGSVADNIRISKADASMDEVIDAAKKASVHDFIQSLPKGYETPVGELGSTLSGGERQRIALARSFLHNAPLLLLDEPTSNIDALNEKIILQSLKEAAADKTVVMVSHRESTLGIADRIVRME